MTTETETLRLLPHQYEFVAATEPWVLTDGGRGSGKTRGLATKVAMRAMHKGAREGLYRQRLNDLKTSTLRTLLEGDGLVPPVLLPGTYSHNHAMKTIKIHGGGEIVYNGMDQGDVARQFGSTGRGSSMNLTGAWFDEWVEITEPNVSQIAMSVRVEIPGLPLQRGGACNPAPPSHYLAERFGIAPGSTPRKGHRRVLAPASENWHNPPQFFDELKALTGVARERYWFGKWVGSDGLVFDRWNREVHVTEDDRPYSSVIVGVDPGYTDPFAAVRIHVDYDGRAHVAREVYETKLVPSEQVERVRSLCGGDNPRVIVDSANPELIEDMRRKGIDAHPATKGKGSILEGVQIVQDRLTVQGDGMSRMTIHASCTNSIREFESYEWKPDGAGQLRDQPIDANNHIPDAVRYALMDLDAGRTATVTSVGLNITPVDDPNRGWSVV